MKLKFKEQQFQIEAVNSLVNCFNGQPKGSRKDLLGRYSKISGTGFLKKHEEVELIAFGNNPIMLTPNEIRENIRKVQKGNEIHFTDKENLKQYSIEMETGTGKTYTYIRSMYELNEKYGWSKFIVMVPSIAIREGVKKSFEITEDHFQKIYKKKIRFFIYNSANSSNIANINSFAADDSIQVMIINYQAFSSRSMANKRIYDELDELQSRKPIDVIKSVRPILIIDEPQKFGSNTEALFDEFNPLFIVRYSATHKKEREFNKIYRLDAVDAYNQRLVKKISVKGIEIVNSKSESAYIYLDKIEISSKHDPIARMEIEEKTKTGTKRRIRKIKQGDNLFDISKGLIAYKGYVVSEISSLENKYDTVKFTNGVSINSGQVIGDINQDHLIRIQIRETIRSHFEKERVLFYQGIKVLSLFFIDEVKKYKFYENNIPLKGDYAKIFEEEYMNFYNENRVLFNDEYQKYLDNFEVGKIHAGYFSIDRKGRQIDSKIDDKKEYLSFDENAYDLIMKNKERLLSFNEPVRFIFSHSALREGWDNPNIFQICTLKHSKSEISKRQEIGRGLRISVNKIGERMDYEVLDNDFHNINTLTVVASESYETFAKSLQKEISESLSGRPIALTIDYLKGKTIQNEFGEEFKFDDSSIIEFMSLLKNKEYIDKQNKITEIFIEDAEKEIISLDEEFEPYKKELINMLKSIYDTANFDKTIIDASRIHIQDLSPNENFHKKEFQDLWNKINIKTVYEVDFDTDELIRKSIEAINTKLYVDKMKVRITSGSQKDEFDQLSLKENRSMEELDNKYINIDGYFETKTKYDLIGELTMATNLSRKTIIKILKEITFEKYNMFKYNPEQFLRRVSAIIDNEKATIIINGITYHKTEEKYSNDIFTVNNVFAEVGENAMKVKKHIYDYVLTDSNQEKEFASALETGEVTVYAKLPNGFKIPTPVGNYNPDWAIVFDNEDFKYVYFIAETKGSMDTMQLRGAEVAKIEYARKHFESLSMSNIKYDVIDSYEMLMNKVMV